MENRIINALESGADMVAMVTASQLRDFAEYVIERQREQDARENLADKEELRPLEYWCDKLNVSRSTLCDKLNVSRSTLWRWEQQGKVMPTRLGGKVYYKASDFQQKN